MSSDVHRYRLVRLILGALGGEGTRLISLLDRSNENPLTYDERLVPTFPNWALHSA